MASNIYGGNFFSSDERQITTIGTGYMANFLSGGGAQRAGATLTNKRVYFSGKVYSLRRGEVSAIKQRTIVNVRDITGVGYVRYDPIGLVVGGVFFFILGLIIFLSTGNQTRQGWGPPVWEPSGFGMFGIMMGILLLILGIVFYFLSRMTLLSIEYAGGNIAFDAKWLQSNEADTFIRNIHLANDKIYSVAAIEQGFTRGSSSIDVDDIPDL